MSTQTTVYSLLADRMNLWKVNICSYHFSVWSFYYPWKLLKFTPSLISHTRTSPSLTDLLLGILLTHCVLVKSPQSPSSAQSLQSCLVAFGLLTWCSLTVLLPSSLPANTLSSLPSQISYIHCSHSQAALFLSNFNFSIKRQSPLKNGLPNVPPFSSLWLIICSH